MARGLPEIKEEDIVTGGFEARGDGPVTVKGISKVITVDDNGDPIFKLSNNELKFGCELLAEDGINPAAFMRPAEFWCLVAAFGGDVTGVRYETRNSPEVLKRAIESANKVGKRLEFIVKNGYVNIERNYAYIHPPEGKYTVAFRDAHNRSFDPGVYDFDTFEGPNGSYEALIFDYEIIGDKSGKPTLYDGFIHRERMYNAFAPTAVGATGLVYDAVKDGMPVYARTPNGGIPIAAKRWQEFVKFFAPSVFEHDWQTDVDKSEYKVVEVLKPQYVMVNKAKSEQKNVVIILKNKSRGKGVSFDLLDLAWENEMPDIIVTDDVEGSSSALENLVNYLIARWPDKTLFSETEDNLVYGPDWKAWAQEVLGGEMSPWVLAGFSLENKRKLQELDDNELRKLLDAFKSRYPLENSTEDW